jgi:hypothetical protein
MEKIPSRSHDPCASLMVQIRFDFFSVIRPNYISSLGSHSTWPPASKSWNSLSAPIVFGILHILGAVRALMFVKNAHI